MVRLAEITACAATLDFHAAQAILAAHALPLGSETVQLGDAAGRVLAEPVVARIAAPRWDCAAMDGYAVRTADLASELPLRVVGTRHAGAAPGGWIAPGEAMRVMTGAPLPEGADRVVMIERSHGSGAQVRLAQHHTDGPHVRRQGEDFAAGMPILARGSLLDPGALVAAAAADAGAVQVWRRPRVRLLATGDEIAAPGTAAARAHAIPDSLSIALAAFGRNWGGEIVAAERAADDPAALRAAARAALTDADVLVIAGGASRGDRDHCRAALGAMGLELVFADIAIKPGKPVWFGRLGSIAVLGLPGNPTAALTVARLFLAPLLAGLGGRQVCDVFDWEMRPLAAPVAGNGDREAFLCAARERDGIRLLDRQSASGQVMLAQARFLLRRPAHAPALSAGTPVPILAL